MEIGQSRELFDKYACLVDFAEIEENDLTLTSHVLWIPLSQNHRLNC